MLDIRKIRENPEFYQIETQKKGSAIQIEELLKIDEKRRDLLTQVEQLKRERNSSSKMIGEAKKRGEDAEEAVLSMRKLGDEIAEIDNQMKALDAEQTELLMMIDRKSVV